MLSESLKFSDFDDEGSANTQYLFFHGMFPLLSRIVFTGTPHELGQNPRKQAKKCILTLRAKMARQLRRSDSHRNRWEMDRQEVNGCPKKSKEIFGGIGRLLYEVVSQATAF